MYICIFCLDKKLLLFCSFFRYCLVFSVQRSCDRTCNRCSIKNNSAQKYQFRFFHTHTHTHTKRKSKRHSIIDFYLVTDVCLFVFDRTKLTINREREVMLRRVLSSNMCIILSCFLFFFFFFVCFVFLSSFSTCSCER